MDKFWDLVKRETCSNIPQYMIIALVENDRGGPFGLRSLKKEELTTKILDYIKNDLPGKIKEEHGEIYFKNLYGKYADDPTKFELSSGLVADVLGIASWVDEKLNNDISYFTKNIKRPVDSSDLESDSSRPKIRRTNEQPVVSSATTRRGRATEKLRISGAIKVFKNL